MTIKEFNQLEPGQKVWNRLSETECLVVSKRDDGGYWFVQANLVTAPPISSAFKAVDPHQYEVINEAKTVQ